jgi:hypothetical protein
MPAALQGKASAQPPSLLGTDVCLSWYSKVDPDVHTTDGDSRPTTQEKTDLTQTVLQKQTEQVSDPDNVKALTDDQTMAAINCLLNLEGKTRPSKIGGATRLDVSQLFATVPINLAALYYISYLYTQNWKHAAAIALRGSSASSSDRHGMYVTRQSAIRAAYEAYRKWFSQVKQIGLAHSRASGLSPLAGTDLEWY